MSKKVLMNISPEEMPDDALVSLCDTRKTNRAQGQVDKTE